MSGEKQLKEMTMEYFLVAHAPSDGMVAISDGFTSIAPRSDAPQTLSASSNRFSPPRIVIAAPAIELHCERDDGRRVFRRISQADPPVQSIADVRAGGYFWTYRCSNCHEFEKVFAAILTHQRGDVGSSTKPLWQKIGETPPFGPHTPARLQKMFGPDIDLLRKGRRCEAQGLGIAAFSYYRRVVENNKSRLFDGLIGAAKKIEPIDDSLIQEFEDAKSEKQFINAVQSLKKAFPVGLRVQNNNPLVLLHDALSDGVHTLSDEECLERAIDVRVVLSALVERIQQLSADDRELTEAITRLNMRKSERSADQA